jgi:hypothetical protein
MCILSSMKTPRGRKPPVKLTTIALTEDMHWQLRQLAAERRTTLRELLTTLLQRELAASGRHAPTPGRSA